MKINYSLIVLMLLFSCKAEKKSTNMVQVDSIEIKDAVLAGGKLHRVNSFPSKYVRARTVDIWTPEDYSPSKKYAVLYMHDGQNLFDATTTWNNQEWQVDEIASKLMKEGITKEFIVVGMHSISEIRHFDYFPKKPFLMLPQKYRDSILVEARKLKNDFSIDDFNADNYLKFIVEEVKPYIDSRYATEKDYKNTVISGSSMGGLISMYAICEYPEVFGKAACLSTHWPGFAPAEKSPVPEAFFSYLKSNLPSPETHKLYFDFGTQTLDQYYPPFETPLNEVFEANGYSEENFLNLKFEGADHSEASWQQRFHIPLTFLLKK